MNKEVCGRCENYDYEHKMCKAYTPILVGQIELLSYFPQCEHFKKSERKLWNIHRPRRSERNDHEGE